MVTEKNSSKRDANPSRRKAVFFAVQAILIPGLAYAALWAPRAERISVVPPLRNEPRVVEPQFDDRAVVTDEQLQTVLSKIRFSLGGDANRSVPKINHVDHCLRMWGSEVVFVDSHEVAQDLGADNGAAENAVTYPSGRQMLSMLTDDRSFRQYWGEKSRPFLVASEKSLRLRTQEGSGSTSHVDHTLATLAEIGVPLSHKIHMRDRRTSLGQLIRDALARFSVNQAEYEWTSLVLGAYAQNADPWNSREGQEITFDRIARRIMRQQYGQGVCYGGHRLFTLTILRRIDMEQMPMFSETVRSEIDSHLGEATRRLVASQHIDGYWNHTWPGSPIHENKPLWDQGRKLLSTGHALEWWAMAYSDVLPPRETIVRAGQWLVREIESMQDSTVQKNLTFLTHAGRSLALWRGGTPGVLFDGATLGQPTTRSIAAENVTPQ